jgi:uncharacterized protein YndB with AHSA1/START domain
MELKYEFYIDATPERVWEAFISPEGVRNTFFGCTINSTFEVGSPYEYVGPGNDGDQTVHVYGTILAYEPGVIFSAIEHPGPSYRDNHAEIHSRMTFTLETVGKCTRLKLIDDEFSDNNPTAETAENHWWYIMSNIKTYAETGKALDFGF